VLAVTGKRSYKEMVGADGSIKSVVRSGDQVIDATTLGAREGKRMVVTGGHHEGLECIVRKLGVGGRQGVFSNPILCSQRYYGVVDMSKRGNPP
jgi:hypothetical protein